MSPVLGRASPTINMPVTINGGRWDEDFLVLASCRNLIISQSTYSWWSAFLGKSNPARPRRIACCVWPGTMWAAGIDDRRFPHLFVEKDDRLWLWVTGAGQGESDVMRSEME